MAQDVKGVVVLVRIMSQDSFVFFLEAKRKRSTADFRFPKLIKWRKTKKRNAEEIRCARIVSA